MKIRATLVLTAATLLAGCDGFKEAMSAHQDVVARAGSQELSATRLGDLIGQSQFPVSKDFAKSVADLWVNYQLLGRVAARNDTLTKSKAFDDAVWPIVARAKVQKWGERISSQFNTPSDVAQAETRYNQGEVLAARHILFQFQPGANPAAKDSLRRRAEEIRTQATPANFAQLASQYSDDGSKAQGGALGVFQRGQMVPEFERGLLAIKPGEISPIVESQFGYHIILRQPFAEVQAQVAQAAGGQARQAAESTYMAKLEQSANVQLRGNAAATAKTVAQNIRAHRDDDAVMATTSKGDFTAGRFAHWLETIPAQANVPQQLAQAPDSLVTQFIKQMVRSDLLLRQADSAKVGLDTAELAQLRTGFRDLVTASWTGLGIDPKTLADSAKSVGERERLASARVDGYMERLLANNAQFVDVPAPLETVLRAESSDAQLNDAGLDRAVQRATQVRAKADSVRRADQPRSAVPLPGGPAGGAPAAGGQPPAPQPAPQPAPKQAAPAAPRP
jgi:peptidyl-prolyl cis-trans isomerase D